MKKIVFIVLVGIILTSCGAKKRIATEIKTEEVTVVEMVVRDTSAVHTDTDVNVIISTDVEEEEITITPLDPTKEIKVDGKVYKNVTIKKKTKKDKSTSQDTTTIRKDSIASSGGRSISINTKKGSIDIIDKETKEPFGFYIYAGGFLLLLLVLYLIYRKFTK